MMLPLALASNSLPRARCAYGIILIKCTQSCWYKGLQRARRQASRGTRPGPGTRTGSDSAYVRARARCYICLLYTSDAADE